MVAEVARRPKPLIGHAKPRVGPPVPLRHGAGEFGEFSAGIGWNLRPWQSCAAKYLTATGRDARWLYREIAIIVARQNGKTTLLVPLIVKRLLLGRRIMHTAQNRELPREVFGMVADIVEDHFPEMLAERGGRRVRPRFANGQEEIRLSNGGLYRIVAPTRGGARGPSNDDVIVDELREMVDHDFIAAAKPTLTASANPQMIYLSNAGTDDSEVLNALRKRGTEDPALAYLEWSAAPDRAADDRTGWAESNPSMGHDPAVLLTLEAEHRAHRLAGTLAIFETEHLCRWVTSLRERLVDDFAWSVGAVDDLPASRQAYLGVAMDPEGSRASAALAWRMPDESIAIRLVMDRSGDPLDPDSVGTEIRELAKRHSAVSVGYDPLTDGQLAKFLVRSEKITGSRFANASSTFALAVNSRKVRHTASDAITDDLTWTAVKPYGEPGSFQAVRADDERPITAALAAIRAVELAANPVRSAARIW